MLYENKTILRPEDFRVLQTAWDTCKSPLRTMRRMQRICFALPGIILLLMGVSGLWSMAARGTLIPLQLAGCLVFLLLGAAMILWPSGNRLARRAWKHYPAKGAEQVITFHDDHFSPGPKDIPYAKIQNILENQRIWLLFFPDGTAYLLHKDAFTAGDPGTFPAFLREKTGLPIETVK